MKKLISLFATMTLSLAGIMMFSSSASCEEKNVSEPIKIMAIGDSITDGYGVSGSYRKYLYSELTKKGYNIDMVGSKGNDMKAEFIDSETGESFVYDDDNTGYSGYTIKEYQGRNGILETLKSTNCIETCMPDIVILQIGTNNIIDNYDMDKTIDDLGALIDYILGSLPDTSALFVTTIPDVDPNRQEVYNWFSSYRHSADWQTNYTDAEAEENILKTLHIYNANLNAEVQKKKSEQVISNSDLSNGINIDFKDDSPLKISHLYNADAASVITDVKAQLLDGVHPNNKGYKLMGEYWAEQLDNYLSQKPAEEKTYKVADLVKLQKFILGASDLTDGEITLEKYDMNKDNRVDIYDIVCLRKELISDL